MSYIFTLSGRETLLSTNIQPPIILGSGENYVLGLIDFLSYYTIPNVSSENNKIRIGKELFTIPTGSYEVNDIERAVNEHSSKTATFVFTLRLNLNTLHAEVKCDQDIDFSVPNSIGSLLGFSSVKLSANKRHISNFPINITSVNSINIECNLVTNSYNNNKPVHVLHMFYPNVLPGEKIIENPSNVIYLPINTHYINEIQLKITDQDGKFINFNKELITIRLHLKKI
nr:TPA_asm: penton [Bos-associated insect adintovirus 2]